MPDLHFLFLLVDNSLLMGAEMPMITLGKSSLGPTRPISLCLKLLCKCQGASAEASSHLQLRGIKPKVRSFGSAWAWQGRPAWLKPHVCHQSVTTLQSCFWEWPLAWGQCRGHTPQQVLDWCSCCASTWAKKHELYRKGWGASPKLPQQWLNSVVLSRLPNFSHSHPFPEVAVSIPKQADMLLSGMLRLIPDQPQSSYHSLSSFCLLVAQATESLLKPGLKS